LKFSQHWLASGDNANDIFIWDVRYQSSEFQNYSGHKAAVRALAWSKKNSNILLSAGGIQDHTIKQWNMLQEKE